jgi:Cu/Ag efflux pump CusA
MVLAGVVAMLVLPISQYPPLVPPQVQISTQYIGAGAEVVDEMVTTLLEEQLNGAAGMIWVGSQYDVIFKCQQESRIDSVSPRIDPIASWSTPMPVN